MGVLGRPPRKSCKVGVLSPVAAEAYRRRHYRWNLIVNLLDGLFFMLGISFVSTAAVLPLFVRSLTDAPLALGLIPAIAGLGGLVPQLFTACYVERLACNKPFVLRASALERFQWLLLAPLVLAVNQIGRTGMLALFYGLFLWWAVGGGLASTAWQNMIATIIPPARRGSFFGLQHALGGLAGVGGALLAGRILLLLPYPGNFALCFLLAGLCLLVSYGFLALTREPALAKSASHTYTMSEYMRRIYRILLTNPSYRRMLLGWAAATGASLPIGFLTLYSMSRFGAADADIAHLTAVLFGAQMVGYLLWGSLGDRYGHKRMLAISTLIGGLAAGTALLAPSAHWLLLVFSLMGIAVTGTTIGGTNLILDIAPPEERPTYIGLSATLLAIPTVLNPLLGGWLVGAFGDHAPFAIAMICALGGYMLLRAPIAKDFAA